MSTSPLSTGGWTPSAARRVEDACARFEAEWQAGRRPCIAKYLAEVPEPERPALLRELVALEVVYRRRAGEAPQAREYEELYPALDPKWIAEALAREASTRNDPPRAVGPATEGASTPASGQDEVPAYQPVPGDEPVAGYQLIKWLGGGGFGEVWEACGPMGFPVALKLVTRRGRAGTIELRSLEIIRNIRHPNLLVLFGAWQTDHLLVIGMELADRTLWDRYREAVGQKLTGIPVRELLRYLQETARALDYLNKPRHILGGNRPVGIQHCDVKPQNILLVGDGVKVGDFGLVQLLERRAAPRAGGMTVSYAAPEFFQDEVTRWSDQYSLAVTYCQLRSGRLPFTGDELKIIDGHLHQPPDLSMLPPREQGPVARALAKSPAGRWPNCRTFVRALADSARGGDGEPPPEPPQEPPQGPAAGRTPDPDATSLLESESRGSVQHWIAQLKAGDPQIIRLLWERYYPRLVKLARKKLRGQARRAADEEDIALEALHSFCLDAAQNKFPQLRTHDDVWSLLVLITAREALALKQARHHRKRGGSGILGLGGEHDLDRIVGSEPSPAFAIEVAEEQQRLLWLLPSDDLRQVAQWKLEGWTNEEIAVKLDCHVRTIGRKLKQIRETWEKVIAEKSGAAAGSKGEEHATPQRTEVGPPSESRRPDEGYNVSSNVPSSVGWSRNGELRCLEGHTDSVWAVAYLPDGRTALSGGADNRILRWHLGSGLEVARWEGHTDGVTGLAVSADGRFALSGSLDGTLRLWDVAAGQEVRRFTGHEREVTSVGLSPDGRLALSGSRDGTVRLWDVATGQEVHRCTGHTDWVHAVAFSPDGRLAASGGRDKVLRLWDTATGAEVRRCEGHTDWINGVTFYPDGNLVLSGSGGPSLGGGDCTLRLWEVASGQEVRRFTGHTDWVRGVAVTPDGRRILSASDDETVRVWDVATGEEISRFEGHTWSALCVAVAPSGEQALSGSDDKTLRLWELPG